MFQILQRFTNAVLFECELPAEIASLSTARQLGYAVKEAVKARANLADANLARANLARADLADAKNVPETNGSEATEPYERATTDEQRSARYAKRSAKFRERNPDVPVIPDIDARILSLVDTGTSTGRVPHFFASNEATLSDLRECASLTNELTAS